MPRRHRAPTYRIGPLRVAATRTLTGDGARKMSERSDRAWCWPRDRSLAVNPVIRPAPEVHHRENANAIRLDLVEERLRKSTEQSTTNVSAEYCATTVKHDAPAPAPKQVRDALKHLGYRPVIADDGAGASGPLLKCKVDKFWFNNYTWPVIFPFVPTWGDVGDGDLGLASGDALWSKSFKGSGFTVNP